MAATAKGRKTTAKKSATEAAATVKESTASINEKPKKAPRVKKDLDPNMFVTVRNGFNGILVYISKKTGEEFIWNEFGEEKEMELSELRNAKNSSKSFFINNYFLIDDQDVLDWLGMSQYYEHALTSENFDDIFTSEPEEIADIISELSDGQKQSLVYRTRDLIRQGAVDSIKVINALEENLGVELVER